MIARVGADLDFLSAVVHGRRSRLAEGPRLDELCAMRSIPELMQALAPGSPAVTVAVFQWRLAAGLAEELALIAERLGGRRGRAVEWLGARFQVENLKVLVRGLATGRPPAELQEFIVPLPARFAVDAAALAAADSLEAFIGLVPSPPLSAGLRLAADAFKRTRRAFFLEAGLDCGYFRELLERAAGVGGGQARQLRVLASQEADMFHLALAARGRLGYGLKAEDLEPFHVSGSAIGREDFRAMLAAGSVAELVPLAAGRVIDLPRAAAGDDKAAAAPSPADLELLALERLHRLAGGILRWEQIGLGAVAAYAALRRVELANLVTLSEGIRAGVAPDAIRRRLVPRRSEGAPDV